MASNREKPTQVDTTALNFWGIPVATYYRLKMPAAVEHKSVKDLLLELIEGKILELERGGYRPRGNDSVLNMW